MSRQSKIGGKRKPDLGAAAGSGIVSAYVISQSKGLSMDDMIQLIGGNLELLLLVATVGGMALPKLVVGLYKLAVWGSKSFFNGLSSVGRGLKSFARRHPRASRELVRMVGLPENTSCKTIEQPNGILLMIEGPAGRVKDRIKGFRKVEKRLPKLLTKLTRRYNAMHQVSTLGTNVVWNPTRNWKDSRGNVHRLEDIETSHLRNIIRVCRDGRSGLGERILDEIMPRLKKELSRREEELFGDNDFDIVEADVIVD